MHPDPDPVSPPRVHGRQPARARTVSPPIVRAPRLCTRPLPWQRPLCITSCRNGLRSCYTAGLAVLYAAPPHAPSTTAPAP
eukprot:4063963-Prymnesium_polylepis.1